VPKPHRDDRPQSLFPNSHRALVEQLCPRPLALVLVYQREIVQARGQGGMIGFQIFIKDRECALLQRLDLRVLALQLIQCGKIVQAGSHIWVLGPEFPFGELQCLLGYVRSALVIPQSIQRHRFLREPFPFGTLREQIAGTQKRKAKQGRCEEKEFSRGGRSPSVACANHILPFPARLRVIIEVVYYVGAIQAPGGAATIPQRYQTAARKIAKNRR